jgi:hypothetical protein
VDEVDNETDRSTVTDSDIVCDTEAEARDGVRNRDRVIDRVRDTSLVEEPFDTVTEIVADDVSASVPLRHERLPDSVELRPSDGESVDDSEEVKRGVSDSFVKVPVTEFEPEAVRHRLCDRVAREGVAVPDGWVTEHSLVWVEDGEGCDCVSDIT